MNLAPREPVLCVADAPPSVPESLRDRYALVMLADEPLARALAGVPPDMAARARVLVVRGSFPLTASTMAMLPALRLIACVGAGYDGVDVAAARARGVEVTHSPGANAASVAELALGLIVALVRGIVRSDALLRHGVWPGAGGVPRRSSRSLAGMRLGVYGLGAIGLCLAHRAEALGMRVAYHNRRQRTDVAFAYCRSLIELARSVDVLAIAAPASNATRHAVDANVLRALGPEGYVVNVARGTIIDETALIGALRAQVIAGAALDVFADEPVVPEALRALPNVIVTPHIAGDTVDGEHAMARMVLANVDALVEGRRPPNPVPTLEACAPAS